MNKKHMGGSFFDDVKKWEEADPAFRQRVNEAVEKRKLAAMLKEIREKEHLTQVELAQKAHVTQSVIARIEGGTARSLPRFDVFNRIVSAAGYEMSIIAKKKGKCVQVAFSS
jgi:DNA-binding XRE family transcriptional regulator